MESRILRSLVVLGVPGVALGVAYLLLKSFGFKFETIPPTWSAIIAVLFIVVVAAITIFALDRYAPPKDRTTPTVAAQPSQGTRRDIEPGMHVEISSVPQRTIELSNGIVEWDPAMNAFCGRQAFVTALSRVGPRAVRLDVDSGKHWWSVEWLKPID